MLLHPDAVAVLSTNQNSVGRMPENKVVRGRNEEKLTISHQRQRAPAKSVQLPHPALRRPHLNGGRWWWSRAQDRDPRRAYLRIYLDWDRRRRELLLLQRRLHLV